MRTLPPVEFLRECFDYEPETGVLTWKQRPAEHFAALGGRSAQHIARQWNARLAGKLVSSDSGNGYTKVCLTFDGAEVRIYAHRVAWVLMTGAWPKHEIDHRNGNRGDNRFSNLREATRAENNQNAKHQSNNTSGAMGVSRSRQTRRWRATITVEGKRKHIGYFRTVKEAHAAYLAIRSQSYPFQPIPRDLLGAER